jgi:hypothetical protein
MDFLRYYFLEDTSVCDRLIDFFNDSGETKPGVCGGYDAKNTPVVDTNVKDSIDLELYAYEEDWQSQRNQSMPQVVIDYLDELQKVCELYIQQFPFVDNYGPWGLIEPFNLQYYKPGGGFKTFHTERLSSTSRYIQTRHLVWMTYLNDVTDQGETEFYHQGYKVNPEKGKTVIWPPDWTYTHRGIPSPTQEKYIITGWYNFWTPEE